MLINYSRSTSLPLLMKKKIKKVILSKNLNYLHRKSEYLYFYYKKRLTLISLIKTKNILSFKNSIVYCNLGLEL